MVWKWPSGMRRQKANGNDPRLHQLAKNMLLHTLVEQTKRSNFHRNANFANTPRKFVTCMAVECYADFQLKWSHCISVSHCIPLQWIICASFFFPAASLICDLPYFYFSILTAVSAGSFFFSGYRNEICKGAKKRHDSLTHKFSLQCCPPPFFFCICSSYVTCF